MPSPAPDVPCRWQPKLTGEMTFTGADIVVVGIHFDCFSAEANHPDLRHTEDFLLAVDAQTGKVVKQRSWSDLTGSSGYSIRLFSTKDNKVLFRAGRTLKLCTSELEELRSRILPTRGNQEAWEAYLPPNGNFGVLILQSIKEVGFTEEHWFSSDTLEDMDVVSAPKYTGRIAVSNDEDVYYSPYTEWKHVKTVEETISQIRAEPPVHVRRRSDEHGRPLCELCRGVAARVSPNGTLFLEKGPPKASFWLVDRAGKVLYQAAYGSSSDLIQQVAVASQRDRFALSFDHLTLSSGGHGQVVVLDPVQTKEVSRVNIKFYAQPVQGGEFWPQIRIAMSPDGNRLAVLYGATLKMFTIDQGR